MASTDAEGVFGNAAQAPKNAMQLINLRRGDAPAMGKSSSADFREVLDFARVSGSDTAQHHRKDDAQ